MDRHDAKVNFAGGVRDLSHQIKLGHVAGAAAAMQAFVGDTSPLEQFSQIGRCDINVLPAINTTLAATTLFANVTIPIAAVTDRFRYVLGFGFEISNLNAAAGTRMGDGPLVQLRNLAQITFVKSTGKSTVEGYSGYDLGAIHAYPDGVTTGVYHADIQEQLVKRLLGFRSVEQAISRPIDIWVPSQGGQINIDNIGGVTVADANSGVQVNTYLLVADFLK